MTEQNESSAGTALEQVAPGVLALVQGSKTWTIADLADKLAGPEPVLPKDAPAAKPAKAIAIGDVLKKALRAIPAVFAQVQPTESRKLEAAELKALTAEAVAISQVTKPLGERAKVISEIVRHHMDHAGVASGLVSDETIRVAEGVAKGHYLFASKGEPFKVEVEGFEDSWEQRYVSGSPSVNGSLVDEWEASGEITRKEYLAMTSERRSFDEAKLAEFIRKNPARGLELLRRMTTRSAPTASLYQPKN